MFSFFKKKPPPAPPPAIVVPRIKHTNFLDYIATIPGMTDESRPLVEPLAGDLLLTYALDVGEGYLSITPATLRERGLEAASLRAQAEANGLAAMRALQVRTHGVLHELTAPDNMAACSLLYPDLWRQIEGEVGGPVAVAVPHRDVVLYARADAAGLAALAEVVATVDFDDTHALSALLFRPTPDGWQEVAP